MATCLAVLVSGTSLPARAQGFDVQPWSISKPVPYLQAVDLDGRTWHLADLRGKAVLINFWASWCPPCLAEMPSLQSMAKTYGPERLIVLTVNFKEGSSTAQRFAQRNGLTLPVLLDPLGNTARQWGVATFPTTVLIGADGRVHTLVRGEVDWFSAEAVQLVAPLLGR